MLISCTGPAHGPAPYHRTTLLMPKTTTSRSYSTHTLSPYHTPYPPITHPITIIPPVSPTLWQTKGYWRGSSSHYLLHLFNSHPIPYPTPYHHHPSSIPNPLADKGVLAGVIIGSVAGAALLGLGLYFLVITATAPPTPPVTYITGRRLAVSLITLVILHPTTHTNTHLPTR